MLKQLPGVLHTLQSQSFEHLIELMMSEVHIFNVWFAWLAGIIQPLPELGKIISGCEKLLFINGISCNIEKVPGTHVKLSMTRPWKVCR